MELYITEISKYVIALLMALYAYESFAVFRFRDEERRGGIYTRQNLLMLVVHFSCFMAICFETGDITYLFFYIFQQIVLFVTVMLFHMVYPRANRLVVNNMCIKENERAAQIFGNYENNHMDSRHYRRRKYFKKCSRLVQSAGNKENKNNFYEFRRLERNSPYGIRNLGSVRICSQYEYYCQRGNPHQCINPCQFF